MFKIKRHRVMVNLVDGSAMSGERLWSWPWSVRLRGAIMHAVRGEPKRLDGPTVEITRRHVLFVQIID